MSAIVNTPTKNISFEVESGTPVSMKLQEAVNKKFQEALLGGKRKNLSREDLTAKLDTAAERKKQLDVTRVQKAKEQIEHVKSVATKIREDSKIEAAEKLEKIQEKLDVAAQAKADQENKKKNKLEQHILNVNLRKEAYNQDYPSPGKGEIIEKLSAAEERRKAFEYDRLKQVASHLKTVEERKSQTDFQSPVKSEQILKKLTAAEQRRKEQEKSLQERLIAAEEHARLVRQRKSERSSMA